MKSPFTASRSESVAKSKTKKKMSEGSRRPSYSKIHNKDPDLEAGSTPGAPAKSDEGEKASEVKASRLLYLGKPEWSVMAVGVLVLVITQLGTMSIPWFFGKLIDTIADDSLTEAEAREEMREIVFRLLVIMVSTSFLLFLRGFIFNGAGERVVARLRIRLFRAILTQEIAFFDKNKTGELLSRLSSDTSKIQDAATSSVSMFLRNCLSLVISLCMMLITSAKLTGVMLICVPLLIAFAVTYGRFVKRIARRYTDALAEASNVANESISNIRTTRAFAAEDVEMARYTDLIGDPDDPTDKKCCWMPKKDHTHSLGMKKALGHGGFIGVVGGLGQVTVVGLLWYGGELVLTDEITAGTLITFMMYAVNTGAGLAVFAGLFSAFMDALGASVRTFQIIDKIPRGDVPVLQNFNLDIAANSTVALVGQSGGGKTTVISLLERFYDVTAGEISIDGKPLKSLDPSITRLNIGMVAQEPVLFGVSITDNICYGWAAKHHSDPAKYPLFPTRERIEEVARMANCHDFIQTFTEGYDTLVGERGVKLSGGQKQRIAIARALLVDPSILLLDEATSALDAQSEELVQGAIDKVMKGRTVIYIAHRLSTIKGADVIVMMKDHKILDKGTHEELMARCGEYEDLVRKQLSKAEE
ncbi:hypothetical protein TrRE_jg11775 [Triparma retinervis]|uniref:ABC transporter n=1 Tax=Triparma retinervis TaxID=2557542 RepID=A0A9W7CEU7_9STRA|nr:hypothetical protein TrRE_jg11775 [Triparma retinervis]